MFHIQGTQKHSCNLLAVYCGIVVENEVSDNIADEKSARYPFPDLVSAGHLEVQALRNPSGDEFSKVLDSWVPTVVYLQGELLPSGEIGSLVWGDHYLSTVEAVCGLFSGMLPTTVYLELPDAEELAEALHSKKMIRQLTMAEVQPGAKNWKANVLVLEKGHTNTVGEHKKIQKLILSDGKGNRVLGIIWDNMIGMLHDNLLPFKKYSIGGATVGRIKADFLHHTPGITIQWTFNRSTSIHLLEDAEMDAKYPNIPFMSSRDMIAAIDSKQKIEILAVVIDVRPIKQRNPGGEPKDIQECIIVHEEMAPITLSLWGDFIEKEGKALMSQKDNFPIVLANKLTPSTFAGVALSTTSTTFIAIEPEIPQANNLRKWAEKNMEVLKKLAEDSVGQGRKRLLEYTTQDQIIQLMQIVPDKKNEWVKVTMNIQNYQQQISYVSCPECKQTVTAEINEVVKCFGCGKKLPAEIKCRVDVQLSDESGTIKATMFDRLAEELLQKTPTELSQMNDKITADILKHANTQLQGKTYRAQLRAVKKNYGDGVARFSIQQYTEVDDTTSAPTKDIEAGEPSEVGTPSKATASTTGKDNTPATLQPMTPEKRTKLN